MQDLIQECLYTMARDGLELPFGQTLLLNSAGFQRYKDAGSRSYEKPNWYKAYSNTTITGVEFVVCVYGSWKTGEEGKYSSGKNLPDEDKAYIKKALKKLQEEAKEEIKAKRLEAIKEAQLDWSYCTNVPNDGILYLEKKGVFEHGVRYSEYPFDVSTDDQPKWERKGVLAIPLSNAEGIITGIQYISKDGEKRINGIKGGSFYTMGEIYPSGRFFIMEGFATAASVHEVTGCPCVMAVDCHNLKEVAVALRKKYPNAEIVIAADNDAFTKKNPGLTKAEEAHNEARCQVVYPVFTDNEEDRFTDWNDYVAKYGKDKAREALGNSSKAQSQKVYENFIAVDVPDHLIVEEVKTYQTTAFLRRKIPVTLRYFPSPKKLKDRFAENKVTVIDDEGKKKESNLFDAWLEDPNKRRFHRMDFRPDQEPGRFTENGNRIYNTWSGLAAEPKPGNCELFKAHMLDVICAGDQGLYDYVWNLLSYWVQNPAELTVSLVIVGGQGSGKGIFTDTIGELFGEAYLTVSSHHQILERFNDMLMGKVLVVINEADLASKKYSGKLKAIITEPTIVIEQKFVPSIRMRNCAKYIFSSNEENPIPIDRDDRRFLQLRTSDHRQRDSQYFENLIEESRNGGVEALLHQLLQTNLKAFNPKKLPETQKHGFEAKIEQSEPFIKFIYEVLDKETFYLNRSGHGWQDEILIQDVEGQFFLWCKERNEKFIASTQFGKKMKDIFEPSGLTIIRRGSKESQNKIYKLPTLRKMQISFCKKFHIEISQIFP